MTGTDSEEVRHALEARGHRVIYTPLDEFQRAAARGGTFELEFRVTRPADGAVMWLSTLGAWSATRC